jgi:predicted Zn-dependent protease
VDLRAAFRKAESAEVDDAWLRAEQRERWLLSRVDGTFAQRSIATQALQLETRIATAVGLASSSSFAAAERCAQASLELAERSAALGIAPEQLALRASEVFAHRSELEGMPEGECLRDASALVEALDAAMCESGALASRSVALRIERCQRSLLSLAGGESIEQWYEFHLELHASSGDRDAERSWRYACRAQQPELGAERLLVEARSVAEEARALATAGRMPRMRSTVVLDHELMAVISYETLGMLSFPVDPERLPAAESRLASGQLSLSVDTETASWLMSRAFDDAGYPGSRRELVSEGYLRATLLEAPEGHFRAVPLSQPVRPMVTNLVLAAGRWSVEELLQKSDELIVVKGARRWWLDGGRRRVVVEGEYAFSTAGAGPWRRPTLSFDLYDFWRACHGVGSERLQLPLPSSGEAQSVCVVPMALFDELELGTKAEGLSLVDG